MGGNGMLVVDGTRPKMCNSATWIINYIVTYRDEIFVWAEDAASGAEGLTEGAAGHQGDE